MKNQDRLDEQGIMQMLQAQNPGGNVGNVSFNPEVAQAAPEITQAASGQAAPANEFVERIKALASGQAPDWEKAYNERMATVNEPFKKNGEFNLINTLNYLGEVMSKAGASKSANRGQSYFGAFGEGMNQVAGERKKSIKDIETDIEKLATDQRKYGLEADKLTNDKLRLARDMQSKDITDQLHLAQTQKALRGPAGGVNWMDKLYAQEEIGARRRKAEREEQEVSLTNKEARKALTGMQESADGASEMLSAVQTMKQMLPDFAQGAKALGGLTHAVGGAFGHQASNTAKTFDIMSKEEFTVARAKMLGSNPTDKDARLLQDIAPDSTNPEAVNRNILNGFEAYGSRELAKTEAASDWVKNRELTGGDINEFNAKWRKYSNAYPLLKKQKDGTLDINANNLDNWTMIFNPDFDEQIKHNKGNTQGAPKRQQQAPMAQPQQAAPNNPYANMSKEERAAIRAQVQGAAQ